MRKPAREPKSMKVIVIRQPWAWLIVNGYKDIENRTWATRYRGTLLIQASATLPSRAKWDEIEKWVRRRGVQLPDSFEAGGIVGMAEIEDCVTRSRSKWFEGPIGWVLTRPRRVRFVPLTGRLGLFDPPRAVLKQLRVLR